MSTSAQILEGFALSPQQSRLWRNQESRQSATWRLRFTIRIDGPLDLTRLQMAWNKTCERHEILRTAFRHVPNIREPLQMVEHSVPPIVMEATASLPDWLFAEQPPASFVALEGPAALAVLYANTANFSLLAISLPSLSADRETACILFDDIVRQYKTPAEQHAETLQYTQFAEWYHELLESGENIAARAFWQRRSPSEPSCLPLKGRSSENDGSHVIALAPRSLKTVTQIFDAAPEDVLLACWQTLLWRLGCPSPIVCGLLVDGRKYAELEEMPGLTAHYLPVQANVTGHLTLRDLVLQAEQERRNAYDWQEGFPLSQPAPSIGFEHQHLPSGEQVGGTTFQLESVSARTDVLDLSLCCLRAGEDLRLLWRFNPAVYSSAYVQAVGRCYETLLTAAAEAPDVPLQSLPLLRQDDLNRWFESVNTTLAEVPASLTHEWIAGIAQQNPDRIAIEHSGIPVTYRELSEHAQRLARQLAAFGAGPETVVAIMMDHSPQLIVAVLATLHAGAAYLPIDPSLPAGRVAFMLEDAGAALLLVQETPAAPLPEQHPHVIAIGPAWLAAPDNHAEQALLPPLPENLAYVVYTSGSTGKPKGSLITHGGLRNYLAWAVDAYRMQDGEGAPLHSSIGFDLTVTSLFGPLLVGKRIVLSRALTSVETLAETLRSGTHFSFLKVTPAHARLLGQQLSPSEAAGKVGVLILGGEALHAADVAFWTQLLPPVEIVNEYGPTETVVGCCVYRSDPPLPFTGPIPIGRPIANTRLYLLDDDFRPAPIGVPAELYIAGAGLARGYARKPDLTADRFVPDPFAAEAGQRLYRSGDLARYLPDGAIEYLGRLDQQVKIRGYRVELGEIESVLAQHASIREACVAVRSGEHGPQLTAYLVPTNAEPVPPSIRELHAYLEACLPSYMMPSAFVWLPQLPLTPNGKVDRKALPAPDRIVGAKGGFVEPRTIEEELLAGVWSQVLHLHRVGIDDNYFSLGGDSIRSLQLIARARERGLSFTVDDLFRHQTIRALAANLQQTREVPAVSEPFSLISALDRRLVPDGIVDAYPLTKLQAGMVFHRQLHPESAIYHDICSFHLRSPLREDLLAESIRALIARHPALRTSFALSAFSQPLQLVHADASLPLQVDDWTHLDDNAQQIAFAEWVKDEKARGFDIAQRPLLRFQVHRRSSSTFQFTLCFHHAILDGWSDATMLNEIAQTYYRLLRGETLDIVPPETEFRDFVDLELQALHSQHQRDFWQRRLEGSEFVRIPRWEPVPRHAPPGIGHYEVAISSELSDGLKQLALAAAVPVKTVLLAAHMRVLAFFSGTTDVTTYLTSVGRPETKDSDRVLGLFLNSTPFRLHLAGGAWKQLAEQAFAVEREAIPYRRYPLSEMQRLLGREQLSETGFYFTHYHLYHGLEQFLDFELVDMQFYEETNITLLANFRLDAFTSQVKFYLTCDQTEIGPEELAAIGDCYHRVLAEMAAHPEDDYAHFAPLPNAEQAIAIAPVLPAARLLPAHEQFALMAAQTPHAEAVRCEEQTLSYRELDSRSDALAAALFSAGARRESIVGIVMERSVELAVSILAVLKAGAAYLPLDPSYPSERLAFVLSDAAVNLLLTQECLRSRLGPIQVQVICVDNLFAVPGGAPTPSAFVTPENLAYVIYTSGSTGDPKGVTVTHRGLSNYLAWCVATYFSTGGNGTIVHSSISFDLTVTALLAPLMAGRPVRMLPDSASSDCLGNALAQLHNLSFLKLTPSHLRLLSHQLDAGRMAGCTRALIVGGEALRYEDLSSWRNASPDTVIWNEYGPTEAVVGCAVFEVPSGPVNQGDVPIGQPISGACVYILDRFLHALPAMSAGDLYIGGDNLARGYHGRASLTAASFIPDPFSLQSGARMYRTGDLARRRHDGVYEFLGRRDDQVKIRGYRIELGEIESTLSAHPGVAQALVTLNTDSENNRRLVAYIVPTEPNSSPDFKDFLASKLPAYMVPSAFILLQQMPLTINGKIDRQRLPAADARATSKTDVIEPRTAEEEILAGAWANALRLEKVGIDDDYFALGGDSIRSIQVVALARERGLSLALHQLFQHPTVRSLADALKQQHIPVNPQPSVAPFSMIAQADRLIIPEGVEDAYPLSRLQAGMLYHRELHPDAAIYHDVFSLHLKAPLHAELLQRAIDELVQRHPTLRTSFHLARFSEPLQLVHKYAQLTLGIDDIGDLDADAQDAVIEAWIDADKQRGFHLASAPLVRFQVHRRTAGTIQFTVCFHHAILDGWSDATMLTEIAQSYLFLLQGEASPFVAPATHYRDFVALEREALASHEAREFWLQRLAGAKPVLLPRTRANGIEEINHRGVSAPMSPFPKSCLPPCIASP